MNEIEVEYTKSGVPKACPGCGHPFHSAGSCRENRECNRGSSLHEHGCMCQLNMAVHLDIPDQPQHGVGGVEREAWIERLVVEHRTALRENVDLRARCASLEAAVDIETLVLATAEAVEDCIQEAMPSRASQMRCFYDQVKEADLHRHLRTALQDALDQHATTTQEGTQ